MRLRLFAAAREAAGRPADEFDAGADGTLGEFLLAATQRYGPEFEAVLAHVPGLGERRRTRSRDRHRRARRGRGRSAAAGLRRFLTRPVVPDPGGRFSALATRSVTVAGLVRILLLRPSRRRALALPVVLALLLVPTQAVGAAGDPVSQAEARVTAARQAANAATARYEDAQTTYYTLEDDIDRTKQQVAGLQKNADALSAVATARALEAYKGGNSDLDAIMNGADVLEAMRRSELLDRVNRQGNAAVDQLGAMTEDLHLQEAELDHKLGAAGRPRREPRGDAGRRAQRARGRGGGGAATEGAPRTRAARARAAGPPAEGARRGRGERDEEGQQRPAAARQVRRRGRAGSSARSPGSSFSDSFGAPRSGGRRHQGVDMMAGRGTSIYAVVSGSVSHSSSGLGGNQIWLHGSDGNTTSTRTCGRTSVAAGRSARATRSARSATPGTRGARRTSTSRSIRAVVRAVNPYPTVRAHC